ncbi:SIS domain-containing protein, partial [Burkholderia cenocepacia]
MSSMLKEARESAQVVAAQIADTARDRQRDGRRVIEQLAGERFDARGSSDHAASYFASLTLSRLGVPVASLPMSVATLQQAPLQVQDQLAIAFSQSGKSSARVHTDAPL